MKRYLFFLTFCLLCGSISAQIKWYDPMEAGFPVIQNQGFIDEIGNCYVRLPNRAHGVVRNDVWNLSRHSAGLSISFYCSSPQISIRYVTTNTKDFGMQHMPATGVSGVDLYSIDSDGKWRFCYGGFSFGDTIRTTYSHLGKDKYHNEGFEYRLYLPLYNGVKWLNIGIPENERITFIPASTEKPIVIYGTSIAQGACASRPGQAWGNILQRTIDYPVINLGFSGNGKLEPEVLNFINEIDSRLYILDCIPNLTDSKAEKVYSLVLAAIKQIRAKHATPILLVEHAGYSNAETDSTRMNYKQSNEASLKAYKQLKAEGVKDLYYISHDDLNFDPNMWVDYVHPSDWGMVQQAKIIEKKVREILRIPIGNSITTQPVTQRREPNSYEWRTRHRDIIKCVKEHAPKAVILGNSITHYWGGAPYGQHKNGEQTWNNVMEKAGFQNMGCGWDRIENVLWRVYHGELDGYQTNKVVLMIGTNNKGFNSDNEIVEGLHFLLSAIHERQPKAIIKVIGILPRRNDETWIKTINQKIRQMTIKAGYLFINAGTPLLKKNGKIDENLFIGDGLHPNEKGYSLIAKLISE
ncbi:MAG: SGNH/GDSL hydrolase family protein [Parabacteroides sp.]|nr:SGNH/GDSL hydrolase family protein [Parabacteroides sp.]